MAGCQNVFENENYASNEELQRLLFQSCLDGQRDAVDSLLSKGVCLDARDKDGRTPLVLSSMSGYEDIVTLILDRGVDVRTREGSRSLMEACENGHWKVVNILVERGCDVNEIDSDGKGPLIRACASGHEKVVEILIDNLSDLNGRDFEGLTALMWACRQGHHAVVGFLIRNITISDLKKTDVEGKTALMHACIAGHDKVVEILMKYSSHLDMDRDDNHGVTALMFAEENRHVKVLEMLIKTICESNERDNSRDSTLMWACVAGKDEVLKLFIEHGARFDGVCINGYTPLTAACRKGRYTTVELLLKQGLDVNDVTNSGLTGLMNACMNEWRIQHFQDDYVKTIRMLLERGGNVDMQETKHGCSASMIAVKTNNSKCLRALMTAGPNLDLVDHKGMTVFLHAIDRERTDCLRILFEDGNLSITENLTSVIENFNIFVTKEPLLVAMEFGVFEWEWCALHDLEPVSLAALQFGFSPGKIKFHHNTLISPFLVSLSINNTELAETFLERLYYFPEDYRMLCGDTDIRKDIINKDIIHRITHRPMTLETWCYLNISKAISSSSFPVKRCEQVDALPIPDVCKKRLNFK